MKLEALGLAIAAALVSGVRSHAFTAASQPLGGTMKFKDKLVFRILLVAAKFASGHIFGNKIAEDIDAIIAELTKAPIEV